MFNNDMNNNQNFGGRNPFFTNNQFNNAQPINQGPNTDSGFFSPFGPQNGSALNQFGNDSFYNSGFVPTNSQDIPPSLDGIKNLSDAPVSEAPTMDALGPAPTLNNFNTGQNMNDPLVSYESGNMPMTSNNSFYSTPNFNYSNNLQTNDILNGSFNMYNNPTQVQGNYNQPIQPTFNQYGGNGFNLPQQYGSQQNNFLSNPNISQSFPNQNNGFEQTSSLNSQNNFNQNTPPVSNYINNDFNNFNTTFEEPKKTEQTSDFSFDSLNSLNGLPPLPVIKPIEDELKSKEKEVQEEEKNIEEETKNENTAKVNDDSNEKPYDIINESMEKEEKPSQVTDTDNELLELGIDDSYNEPDTLDIIEEEPEKKVVTLTTDEVKKIVDNFKSLIDDEKKKGNKIDLEEFDFEEMYQLIIKISKNKTE